MKIEYPSKDSTGMFFFDLKLTKETSDLTQISFLSSVRKLL